MTRRGYNSRLGNDFNSVTVAHVLQNPKYKGWYCGNKTQSLDYRSRKTAFLDEEEWVMYPDPNIPAIVSEELWDKANEIFKARSARAKAYGVGYQSRYPYSGKIICGNDGKSFHRQTFKTLSGEVEYWRCKTYRAKGKTGCGLPSVRTTEINAILGNLFQQVIVHQQEIVQLVLQSISDSEQNIDYTPQITQMEEQIKLLDQKKDRLLDLSIAEAITISEFKRQNSRFNEQIDTIREQLVQLKQKALQSINTQLNKAELERALWDELKFQNGINSEIVSTILDHLIVCKNSTKNQIYLEIFLRLGQKASVHYSRDPFVFLTTSFS